MDISKSMKAYLAHRHWVLHNKEKVKEYQKKYVEEHKEEIKERMKYYRLKKKLEKVENPVDENVLMLEPFKPAEKRTRGRKPKYEIKIENDNIILYQKPNL